MSNVTTDFDASVADEESKTRKPKRGSRVSKTSRPSRNKGKYFLKHNTINFNLPFL